MMERSALCRKGLPIPSPRIGFRDAVSVGRINVRPRVLGGFCRNPHSFALIAPPKPLCPVLIRRKHGAFACESTPSGESSAQPTPPSSDSSREKNLLVEAFSAPPELTAVAEAETWPAEGGLKAAKYDAGVTRRFFNRENELRYIEDCITDNPDQPMLLLGPRNCGKTALLKRIKEKDESRFLYLDCGMRDLTDSSRMARALREQAWQLPLAIGWRAAEFALKQLKPALDVAGVFAPPAARNTVTSAASEPNNIVEIFMEEFFPKERENDLYYVINTYAILLKQTTEEGKQLVIIIDEINALKNWTNSNEEAKKLKILLEFFKRVCKQEGWAHLILATSESSMVSWLVKNGFTGDLRTDEVLGDLTREEALRFVRGGGKDFSGKEWPGLVNGYTGTPALHKEDWENVWAMCGGNIHLLRVCVKKASRFKDWGKAVESVGDAPEKDVKNVWFYSKTIRKPEGVTRAAALWAKTDYKTAARLIAAAAPYYAVPEIVLVAELEKDPRLSKAGLDGAQVLQSMIEYNVLSVRPYSYMARDIPRDVFVRKIKGVGGIEKERKDSVVVMPSQAHLHAALDLVDLGLPGLMQPL